jgi:predicted nucleic acid-binding Zn ribbon protein
MERAARLIKNKKVSREILSDEDIARAVWPTAVGKAIAAHTSRLKLVRTTLVVEVEDAMWQKQLHFLSRQIVARVRKLTGSDTVQDVEFRIGVPRREVQRAETNGNEVFGMLDASKDDADGIEDPVLKKVYRLSRRKATG